MSFIRGDAALLNALGVMRMAQVCEVKNKSSVTLTIYSVLRCFSHGSPMTLDALSNVRISHLTLTSCMMIWVHTVGRAAPICFHANPKGLLPPTQAERAGDAAQAAAAATAALAEGYSAALAIDASNSDALVSLAQNKLFQSSASLRRAGQ